ncbi:MAG: exosome subunit [Archaeoglobaceae archaeon]|nr:exosome subunit [Archaeoglobaceae archaeon]MCX8151561.1 exosome subunit [Archaeoglobaceae archaeon]MDW8013161.1 RNA-binding domain-containing protein [Archaeoglobaceae archaeon]
MNGKIEWIKVSAVVHSTEDREKVGETIANLFPFEFKIEVSKAKGHYGNLLEYLEVEIKKEREIRDFWNNLMKLLSDQKSFLIETLEERIDAQNVLHIRIDKQKAYFKKICLIEKGDSISVKVKAVTYPARREKVVEFFKKLCSTS